MKQETNNEMDLLLRRLSRRQGVPVSDVDEDHLDADELNSYAENALPAAARERYTEHLAECSSCRELVVQLSGSVPVVAAKETLTTAPSAFRKFLANLLSPMVLRYAVPALGVIIVAGIGLIVLRSSNKAERYVAQSEPAATQPAPAVSQTPDSQAQFYDSAPRTAPKESAGKPVTGGEKQEDGKTTSPVHTEPPAPATASDRVEPQANAAAAPIAAAQQVASASPAPPSAPKAVETTDEVRVEVEGRKPQVRGASSNEVARSRNYEAAKDAEKQKRADEETKKTALAPSAQTKSGSQTSGGAFGVAEADRDKGDGVMRSVGGRRFRKQDGMWVDTAYASGSAIVNVARGSEQYRALIADEPTIKTIADQLEGTIIVVWKSRTYRIR